MSESEDILTRAIATLTGDLCLRVGPELIAQCRPVEFVEETRPFPESAATWVCASHAFFTLIKDRSTTLVFSHSNQTLYYASPAVELGRDCPSGVALLCQFTMDSKSESKIDSKMDSNMDSKMDSKMDRAESGTPEPRLLVFDVLSCPMGTPAMARGEHLRALAVHLQQPLCCVQWVGLGRYLTAAFVSRLPHPVKGLCQISDEAGKLGVVRGI